MRRHKELILAKRIKANRQKYPSLYKIVDSPKFRAWYKRCTGREWSEKLEIDVEEMAIRLNAMQEIYGEIPC